MVVRSAVLSGVPRVPVCLHAGTCRYPYSRQAGCPSGQWERTVNPSRKLPRFESSTRHPAGKTASDQHQPVGGRRRPCPVESSRIRGVTAASGQIVGRLVGWITVAVLVFYTVSHTKRASVADLTPWASRRAGFALPCQVQPGQARRRRPRSGVAWRGWTWCGCLGCAAGRTVTPGLPRAAEVPGRAALAAGGRIRVLGPEALPAGGTVLVALTGESRGGSGPRLQVGDVNGQQGDEYTDYGPNGLSLGPARLAARVWWRRRHSRAGTSA